MKRIRHRKEFEAIREQGERRAKGALIANWMLLPNGSECRLGIITTRKLGSAVVRNRARRLIRETFRLQCPKLKRPIAVVIVARPSIIGRKRQEVEQDFLAIMRRAKLLIKEAP